MSENRRELNAQNRSLSEERKGLAAFKKSLDSDPDSVYHLLPSLKDRYFSPRAEEGGRPYNPKFAPDERPNLHFTMLVALNNSERIAGELILQKNYKNYRYLLALSLLAHNDKCSNPVTKELDSSDKLPMVREFFKSSRHLEATARDALSAISRLEDTIDTSEEVIARLLLLERLSGDPIIDGGKKLPNWSTLFSSQDLASHSHFNTGSGSALSLIYSALHFQDPVFLEAARRNRAYLDCQKLMRLAESELEALPESREVFCRLGNESAAASDRSKRSVNEVPEAESAESVFDKHCSDCHSGNKKTSFTLEADCLQKAPASAASSAKTLQEEILQRLDPEHPKAMPKDSKLSDSELRILRDYLSTAKP